jgi:alpha-1,6-mannosyltransferase
VTICDFTHAYHETSGGIRTFVNARRRYILAETAHTHALLIPGDADATEAGERWITRRVRAPLIPGAAPYRFFSSARRAAQALWDVGAEVVELGTYFMPTEHRAAFRHRDRMRAAGRRCIVTAFAHTDFDRSYVASYSAKVFGARVGNALGRLAGRYVGSVLSRCDAVFCLSEPFREHLTGLGVSNVTVVPLGVDTETFSPAKRDPMLRRELGVPDGGAMFVYAGRLDSEKRTAVMVEAARQAHAAHPLLLVMAGHGPHRAELEAQEAAGAPIRVLPYQKSPADLARLLATADVYLTAGPFETFGLSVVEAQACGLPVVGVEAGALPDRVPPGLGFLGPVDDSSVMAGHLLDAFRARTEISPRARHHVESMFTWDRAHRTIIEIYNSI